LDSEASYQVVSIISELAKKYNKTVLMTIHQPASSVYNLFDKICLLSVGRVVYFGDLPNAVKFFDSIGKPVPAFYNPPEHYLEAINTDFMADRESGKQTIDEWAEKLIQFNKELQDVPVGDDGCLEELHVDGEQKKFHHANGWLFQSAILTERSFVNAGRNLVLYWIRVAMFSKSLTSN
jgi:ABC-type multidrug transport system ATPase subunit